MDRYKRPKYYNLTSNIIKNAKKKQHSTPYSTSAQLR